MKDGLNPAPDKNISMKEKYSLIVTAFALISIILYSCNGSDKRIAANLYKEREYLFKEFKDKSVISRGEVFYQLSYYKGQSVNTFYFEKKDTSLILTNDTLQYPLNEIAAFATVNIADSSNYRKFLSNELGKLLRVMDDFKISHVSAEDRTAGVDMKIYFGDYKALLYVSNIAAVKNERWKNYIQSGEKLDENWYSVKDELSK
jgi:hypothetical protein